MVILWYKLRHNIIKKRYSLYSLGIGIIFFSIIYAITKDGRFSVCIIRNLFGVPCLGCGLSRGFVAIWELDFAKAITYNYLSVPLFFGGCAYVGLMIWDVLFDTNGMKYFKKWLLAKPMLYLYGVVFLHRVLDLYVF